METNEGWKTIVRLTSEGSDSVITSMRIPVLMAVMGTFSHGPSYHLRNLFRALRLGIGFEQVGLRPFRKGRILCCFPHSTPSNVNNLIPVALESQSRGLLGGIVIGDKFFEALRQLQGEVGVVSLQGLFSSLQPSLRLRLISETIATYRRLMNVFSAPGVDQEFSRGLKSEFSFLFREIYLSLLAAEAFIQILPRWNPSVIVTTSDFWPFEYQLCNQAARLRIPSIVIQHGFIANNYWWPFRANRCFLWGKPFLEQMLNFGADSNRLMVCGMPASDELFKKHSFGKDRSVTKGGDSCLILSHTHDRKHEPEIYLNYATFLKSLIASTPFVSWKVRLHPVEDDSFYRDLGSDIFKRLTILPKSATLEESIMSANVASTIYSTSGLEAMMMQKPLIVFNVSPKVRELAWWPSYGGGNFCSTPKEFEEKLVQLFQGTEVRYLQLQKQETFLAEAFANRGCSAKAIVDLLESYCTRV